jgi:hypothetical protein
MSEYYDESVLLYRIIPQERRIEFIYVTDKINALDTINDEDICNLSFDELLRDTIEFRQHYPAIQSILKRLIVAVYKEGKKELEEILNEFDVFNTDFNYILKYYINKFKRLFYAEHAYMNHLALQLKAKKENRRFKLRINKIIENLQIIADQDYFSSLSKITQPKLIPAPDCFTNPESDLRLNYGDAILVINNHPIIYEIADISLLKFFNKLNYNLYEMEQYIYNCKHCHKEFFGNLGASYCSAPACQKELKRLERNRKERERQNSPYIKPKTSLNNYISTYKTIFRKKVNDDAYWIGKFEAEEKRIKDIVKEEVERREKANSPTDDDEMNQFIINHKHDMYEFMYNLLDEYGNNNS